MHKSFQVGDLRDLEVAHVVAGSRSSRVGHIVAVFSEEDTEMKIAGTVAVMEMGNLQLQRR